MVKEIKEVSSKYERWMRTPEGMYFDEKEKEILISALRFKTGEKVLEIGAGTGRYISYLSELGLNMTGVEPMEELFRIALIRSDINDDQMVKASAEKLPFEDNAFDTSIFVTTFEYVNDKEKALKEAFRVSKNKVGIGFFNRNASSNFIRSLRKSALFTDAQLFSPATLRKFAEKVLLDKLDKIEITFKNSIFLPVQMGRFVPLVDDILEKTNLPFGNFAVMVIKKR